MLFSRLCVAVNTQLMCGFVALHCHYGSSFCQQGGITHTMSADGSSSSAPCDTEMRLPPPSLAPASEEERTERMRRRDTAEEAWLRKEDEDEEVRREEEERRREQLVIGRYLCPSHEQQMEIADAIFKRVMRDYDRWYRHNVLRED